MGELTVALTALDAALAAKDLEAGKAALEQCIALRKKYHLKLGV